MGTRPSSDRLKEALFSSLGEAVKGARVLDLYAGSGALGIEALSRGAAAATFVEQDGRAVRVIHSNLAATGLAEAANVVHSSVEDYVKGPAGTAADLVLIDPPYRLGLPSQVLDLLLQGRFIHRTSTVVVEASARIPIRLPPGYLWRSQRRYGDSLLLRLAVDEDGC